MVRLYGHFFHSVICDLEEVTGGLDICFKAPFGVVLSFNAACGTESRLGFLNHHIKVLLVIWAGIDITGEIIPTAWVTKTHDSATVFGQ